MPPGGGWAVVLLWVLNLYTWFSLMYLNNTMVPYLYHSITLVHSSTFVLGVHMCRNMYHKNSCTLPVQLYHLFVCAEICTMKILVPYQYNFTNYSECPKYVLKVKTLVPYQYHFHFIPWSKNSGILPIPLLPCVWQK